MANDFSGDAACKGVWRFESGALTTDASAAWRADGGSKPQTLTENGTPASDTGDFKEGSGCVDLETTEQDGFYIADSALCSGFPLANGDTNKKISVCFWFKPESFTYSAGMFAKHQVNKYSLLLYINTSATFYAYFGYSSGNSHEAKTLFTSLQTGRWYHFGFTYQDSDRAYVARLWDDTAGDFHAADATGNASNAINVEDSAVYIGSWQGGSNVWWDGRLDEMVVFSDVLSTDEINQIRTGTYGAAAAGHPASKRFGGIPGVALNKGVW